MERSIGRYEGVLRHIFGIFGLAHHFEGYVVDEVRMFLDNGIKIRNLVLSDRVMPSSSGLQTKFGLRTQTAGVASNINEGQRINKTPY